MKGKGEREQYAQMNTEFQRIAKRDKKAFFIQCKEIRKTVEWERLRSHQENWRYHANISHKDGHNKGQKWQNLNRNRRE